MASTVSDSNGLQIHHLNATINDRILAAVDVEFTEYVAKNVSNDHDFTKFFIPTNTPTRAQSSTPSALTLSTNSPSTADTSVDAELCPGIGEFGNDKLRKNFVYFDYEIVTPDINTITANTFDAAIEKLENMILQDMADNFLSCNGRRTTLTSRRILEENGSNVVRLESGPKDVIDTVNADCISNVNVEDPVSCTPMIGGMTFYTNCDTNSCQFPLDGVLLSVEDSCEDDIYVDGNIIKQVNFIGTRQVDIVIGRSQLIEEKPVSMAWAFSSAAVAVGCALLGLFFYKRRKPYEESVDLSSYDETGFRGPDSFEGVSFDTASIDDEGNLNSFKN